MKPVLSLVFFQANCLLAAPVRTKKDSEIGTKRTVQPEAKAPDCGHRVLPILAHAAVHNLLPRCGLSQTVRRNRGSESCDGSITFGIGLRKMDSQAEVKTFLITVANRMTLNDRLSKRVIAWLRQITSPNTEFVGLEGAFSASIREAEASELLGLKDV